MNKRKRKQETMKLKFAYYAYFIFFIFAGIILILAGSYLLWIVYTEIPEEDRLKSLITAMAIFIMVFIWQWSSDFLRRRQEDG